VNTVILEIKQKLVKTMFSFDFFSLSTLGNRQLVGYKNSFTYTGSFNFFGLEPATQYEVIIQSRNREGWSDPSEIFKFSTRPHGKYTSYILTKNKPKTLNNF
jgi:hypothetical protein